jgi:DHA2 family multidrug resistance protein
MAAMQIMLDKGEENDWFSSRFICVCAFLFIAGLVALVPWELRVKEPLINLRVFRFRNFAICCFLMALVGGVLNANTVLQPQFTQQLLGWTATRAGMALTAGGFTLVVMMPFAGFATGKVSARTLTLVGFSLMLISFRYAAAVTNLDMSFAAASWLRVIQMMPLPFCFISITTAAYVGIPKEDSNQVAGLINFSRNIGGSILIAITNAQVTSRSMWHEQHLQQSMQSGSLAFQQHQQFRLRKRERHGPRRHLQAAHPAGPHAGLSGRIYGAVLDVPIPHCPGLPAQQERPRQSPRSRGHALEAIS